MRIFQNSIILNFGGRKSKREGNFMQDEIVREIVVKADKEKVYNAITDPDKIAQWFPDEVEGKLVVGEQPIFVFSSHNHRSKTYIEAADPFDYFAYRWLPGSANIEGIDDVRTVPNTLVEFFIEDSGEGTKITLKESGFASLPADVAEASFKDNNGGWDFMIERLENLLNEK